jgi:hypothetical protein
VSVDRISNRTRASLISSHLIISSCSTRLECRTRKLIAWPRTMGVAVRDSHSFAASDHGSCRTGQPLFRSSHPSTVLVPIHYSSSPATENPQKDLRYNQLSRGTFVKSGRIRGVAERLIPPPT